MNFELSDEVRMIQETARKFSENELAPYAAEMDEKEIFPRDAWKKLSELGFAGLLIPEEYGGLGLDYVSMIVVMEEFGKGCIFPHEETMPGPKADRLALTNGFNVVLEDLRFANEAAAVYELTGKVVRVIREGVQTTTTHTAHRSETEQAHLKVDHELSAKDGQLEMLYAGVEAFLDLG